MIKLSWLLFSLLFLPRFCQAQQPALIINEIAWMGTQNSGYDEWLELVNNSEAEVDLSGWQIVAQDGSPEINLSGEIVPGGFYLLERTNDDSVAGVTADIIYSGSLSNSGETLYLKNAAGDIVDTVLARAGWPAGDNDTKTTMQYCHEGWVSAVGTPKQSNQCLLPTATPTITPTPTPTLNPTPTLTPTLSPTTTTSPSSSPTIPPTPTLPLLYLNEVVPDPDDGSEQVELYNPNEEEVVLEDWLLDDIAAGSSPVVFSAAITSQEYWVLSLDKSMFNNSGDAVRLIAPDSRLVDTTEYPSSQAGYSWSRSETDWCWATASLGEKNNSCRQMTTLTPTTTPTPTLAPTGILTPTSTAVTPTEEPASTAVLGWQDSFTHLPPVYQTTPPPPEKMIELAAVDEKPVPANLWLFSGTFFLGLGVFRFLAAMI